MGKKKNDINTRADAYSKIFTLAYERASTYANLILVIGYASFFAIWSNTKEYFENYKIQEITAVLLMMFSIAVFVGFEINKMVRVSCFQLPWFKTLATTRNTEQFEKTFNKYIDKYEKFMESFYWYWVTILALTIGPAVIAIAILAYVYVMNLIAS